ncbi:venom dipeptidyl peptidase 4-like isoform X3 [Anopheles albimanus]|uniref:venom dipeptidyl peptidase 4-like isoform X3 n=1 Tax=Anopheles albimanus TaxID=7167 RepID=UPI00163FC74E|nr:venom dipeptidyl peptidase 4-like isoform X3 [Anopheles albimanus]XP_035782024.1 venom dipeptidyl peptidase 4-like isoform X3 [Anopheles albimanus]XP_035782025.1 venom dipeptidyl peptidase 4-like isoform X3 [Anopheles albimanus]XP_035782026.1 venom dipeptidyl peptidase 4-like isoform X3 [Anopheles albimanus]XP_035782027.1 venom dipeptidyl peptidase 4-like isoform X3 [Anopheles albimanus]XP_035782029.1 venom dipeptidyl peptidase 4-like isoform X3 [Anopheles albimanus]XP_035782030.1 venom di
MTEADNYDDELVSANPNQRNWRGILIALLVIIVVLALIVTSVVLLTPPDEGPRVKGQRIRLQDIIDGEYAPKKLNGSWIGPDEFLYQNHWGEISLLSMNNLSERVLMSNTTMKTLAPVKFSISADRRYLLLAQNVRKLFRHSQLAQYTIYDIATSETIQLAVKAEDDEWPFLLHAEFTPKGQAIVLVYKYDIYYKPSARAPQTYRLTKNAIPGIVYNGVPDWLYEEEILQTNKAIWLSADGHLMLYTTFNDTLVQEQQFAWYGTPSGDINLYPEIRSLRYPKPGTSNPTVTLNVADLTDPKSIRMNKLTPPPILVNQEHYFTSASWISPSEVSVVWMNRPQNLSVVTLCKSPMWYCQETHRISGDGRGWVDEMSIPFFSLNGSSYIAISPLRDGAAGHFRHLVHVHIGKKRIIPLTHGRFEVNKILHWDQANNFVYYLGIPEHSPAQQHLYRASSLPPKQGTSPRPPRCLTCTHQHSTHTHVTIKASNRVQQQWNDDWEDIEDEEEEYVEIPVTTPPSSKRKRKPTEPEPPPPPPMPCQYFTATFAPSNSEYALIECLGPIVPFSAIYRIVPDVSKSPTQVLYYLQNNTALAERISKVALPQVKSFPVMISGGYHAQVRLFLPPGLREDEITRYPMIVHVYSAPGSQLVTDKWRVDWNTYLAGTKDYIVTQIDGRGSSGQGYQLLHEVYRRLGTVEVSDQLEVAEYLRDSLHFVDKRRVGIWGWSYGGYTAALAMASPTSLFQCGISVAPVTNWKLYDSTYTERFMGMPNVTDNYKGYEDSDLSRHAEKLRDKQFLMVHGTADDNVHFQQSMVFSKALSSKGALFKQLIYPDEGHNLAGVRKHLYRSMTLFFEDCFRKLHDDEPEAKRTPKKALLLGD